MKKILSIAAMMVITALLQSAHAQDQTIAYNAPGLKITDPTANNESNSAVSITEVNIKAARDFIKRYKDIEGEKWYKAEDGFFACFDENDIHTKVAYHENGTWYWTLRTLNETQLPFDVRDLAKSTYYDFNILVAYEIEYETGVTYILKIEDKTRIKVLKIHDGEMDVTGDYIKK